MDHCNARMRSTDRSRDTEVCSRVNRFVKLQTIKFYGQTKGHGASSKSFRGTGQAGTANQNPGLDPGRNNHYFSLKIRDGTLDRKGQLLFFSYNFLLFIILD